MARTPLARALAAEVGALSEVLLAKGYTLRSYAKPGRENGEGTDPDDLLRFLELQDRIIFDANAGRISLLEVIQEFGELGEGEGGLVDRVVGFYEVAADFRSATSEAKLQKRSVTSEEVTKTQEALLSSARFGRKLSDRLVEFARLSEESHIDSRR